MPFLDSRHNDRVRCTLLVLCVLLNGCALCPSNPVMICYCRVWVWCVARAPSAWMLAQMLLWLLRDVVGVLHVRGEDVRCMFGAWSSWLPRPCALPPLVASAHSSRRRRVASPDRRERR